ncbi:MAG: hypothetical protein Q7S60_03635 [bacterium]|nr:hypothetical protein [bacterium]
MAAIEFDTLKQSGLPSSKDTSLGDIITKLIPYLLTAAGLLLLLYLIYGGFSLMMSRGDPKAMEAAKGKITNAAIGFAIVFTAYWLVQLLGQILGIQQFGELFGG